MEMVRNISFEEAIDLMFQDIAMKHPYLGNDVILWDRNEKEPLFEIKKDKHCMYVGMSYFKDSLIFKNLWSYGDVHIK